MFRNIRYVKLVRHRLLILRELEVAVSLSYIFFAWLDCRIVVLNTIHWDHDCTNHALTCTITYACFIEDPYNKCGLR